MISHISLHKDHNTVLKLLISLESHFDYFILSINWIDKLPLKLHEISFKYLHETFSINLKN